MNSELNKSRGRPKGEEKVSMKIRVRLKDKAAIEASYACYRDSGEPMAFPIPTEKQKPVIAKETPNAGQTLAVVHPDYDRIRGGVGPKSPMLSISIEDMERFNKLQKDKEEWEAKMEGMKGELEKAKMVGYKAADPNVPKLLEDIVAMEKEKKYWEDRFHKAVAASEGQLVSYWRAEANKYKERVVQLESQLE